MSMFTAEATGVTEATCKIEERKNIIKKMNPREITIKVYELFELYSNLPFIFNKSSEWDLIDETTELSGKSGGNIVRGSINFSNTGKSRNLKQYVFNYKITTQMSFWGTMYKKQSFYPLMGWEKRFGESPSKEDLKNKSRIVAFQKFMKQYETSFSKKHFAVWEHMKVEQKLKVYDCLSDKTSEKTRTKTLKGLVEKESKEAQDDVKNGLQRLNKITRLTSWHIKDEDIRLKRDKFDEMHGWTEGSENERPSDEKSDHDILREWRNAEEDNDNRGIVRTTYDKILDEFADTTGPIASSSRQASILYTIIDNRKISRNLRALENTLVLTESGESVRGGAAIIAAKIAIKQMTEGQADVNDGLREEFNLTTKMKNFQHHSFFENIGGGTWDIVDELKNALDLPEKARSEEDDEEVWDPKTGELIDLWKNNFQNGVWLKIELPSVPHAITVIIKDGKIFSAGGGYNDATIAIGGDGGFHYGDFYLYSPDHLFSDWDDQMYNSQNIVGWGFYNKKILEKIQKYEIEKKSKEGYLKVKDKKYCTIANSFLGSNCARFTNDITNKGFDVFYSSPASSAGYNVNELNKVFLKLEGEVYLKKINNFLSGFRNFEDADVMRFIEGDEDTDKYHKNIIFPVLLPDFTDDMIEERLWNIALENASTSRQLSKKDIIKKIVHSLKEIHEKYTSELARYVPGGSEPVWKYNDLEKLKNLQRYMKRLTLKRKTRGGRKKRSRRKKKRKGKKKTRRLKK